jgi:hypothetical protein
MSRYVYADEEPQGRYVFVDETPTVVKAGNALNDIPRQVGLTARHGIEGLAEAAQLVTEPIAGLMRMGGIKTKPLRQIAAKFSDSIGLPTPQNATERVVGDASRLVAGGGGVMGTAGWLARGTSGITQSVFNALASNPLQQTTAAAGAGLAGGSSREAGGSDLQQAGAALLGGVAGGLLPGVANTAATTVKGFANKLTQSPAQIDQKLSVVFERAGADYSQVPERVRQTLRQEAATALAQGRDLNPQALARLADFRALNVTPTRGMVTLDPVQITREQNLAKIGANSADGELQGLARVQNQNNQRFIQVLNEGGANRGSLDAAGDLVVGSVTGRRNSLRGAEQAAWNEARSSPGYRQPISAGVISDINAALGDEGMMPFMNPTISRYMEAFQTGQPFTPQDYRNLQSMLAREVSKGGNEGAAASLARRVLEQSDLRPAGFADAGNALTTPRMAAGMRAADQGATDAIDAVNRARAATRTAYAYEDSSPLVRSVLSDAATSDPQRIAQRFVIGGTAREAADLAQQVGPQGQMEIKNALVAYLKEKALNQSADEVGKFSQSAYNKAFQDLARSGKLDLFFSREEITQLEQLGRVASYAQVQPVGAAVNNSNSGALMLGRGLDVLNQIPILGPNIAPAIKNIEVGIQQRAAQNIAPGLLATQPKQSVRGGLLAPVTAYSGGLLAAPMVDDR